MFFVHFLQVSLPVGKGRQGQGGSWTAEGHSSSAEAVGVGQAASDWDGSACPQGLWPLQASDGCDRRNRAHFFTFPQRCVRRQPPLRRLVTGHNNPSADQPRVQPRPWPMGQSPTALSDLVCYVTLLTQTGGLGGSWDLHRQLVL